MFILINR